MSTKGFTLFPGQGVQHAVYGYGTVHGLKTDEPGRATSVTVGFTNGEYIVPASSLGQAVMPEAELLLLRAKHAKPKKSLRPPRKPVRLCKK